MASSSDKSSSSHGEATGKHLEHAAEKQAERRGPSEAKQHSSKVPKEGGEGLTNDQWKVVGSAVAVVAAIALGITIKKKSGGKSKREEKRDQARGFLDDAGRKLKSGGRWFGDKAETAKDKAEDAGEKVSDKASEVLPQPVQDAASNIKERANVAGIKAEKEGLKASEKSDTAVRKAADKVLHKSDVAARRADRKSDGLFSGIGNWFRDRKDDAVGLAEATADKVKGEA